MQIISHVKRFYISVNTSFGIYILAIVLVYPVFQYLFVSLFFCTTADFFVE